MSVWIVGGGDMYECMSVRGTSGMGVARVQNSRAMLRFNYWVIVVEAPAVLSLFVSAYPFARFGMIEC